MPARLLLAEVMRRCFWSTMHGLAGVMNGPCIDKLELKAQVLKRAVRHAMARMGHGLSGKV